MKARKIENPNHRFGRVLWETESDTGEKGYVLTSSIRSSLASETMAFTADEQGGVTDWLELCQLGPDKHEECMRWLGYEIVEDEDERQ